LHRELIAWLRPESPRTRVIVETLAEAWWEKMRRVRNWVGAGTPDTSEIDHRIEDLLQRFVLGCSVRHRNWRHRLELIFGRSLYGPTVMRRAMEARLASLGGKAPARKRPSWQQAREDEKRRREAEAVYAARLAGQASEQRSGGKQGSGSERQAGLADNLNSADEELDLILAELLASTAKRHQEGKG
jgi:hypothetical protein